MPFYPQDFWADTLDLRLDEIGAYFVMICLAWKRGDGSVPGNPKELKRMMQCLIADFHGLTFNRIVPKLLERYFERREDGNFYQKRVEKELIRAREISEKQSRNVRERWAKDRRNKLLAYTTVIPTTVTKNNTSTNSESEKEVGEKKPRSLAEVVRAKGWV